MFLVAGTGGAAGLAGTAGLVVELLSGENLRLESIGIESPLVLELFKILRASLTFLGTEAGGWGGAVEGKVVGPGGRFEPKLVFCSAFMNIFRLASSLA